MLLDLLKWHQTQLRSRKFIAVNLHETAQVFVRIFMTGFLVLFLSKSRTQLTGTKDCGSTIQISSDIIFSFIGITDLSFLDPMTQYF